MPFLAMIAAILLVCLAPRKQVDGVSMSYPQRQPASPMQSGYSLRFYGNGVNAPDLDRVKIPIDDPTNSNPGPPADIGATDFTLEFWMKASAADNTANAISCGWNVNWIYGNIVFDRDRYNQDRKFGLSLADGHIVFGVSGDGTGDYTLCSIVSVLDNQWHHIAVQRRRADGYLWLYVDGVLQSEGDGPDGDISYPDNGVPGNYCGGPCTNSDPYLVIGAEKHDAGAAYPSYNGWLDEIRLSKVLRYANNFHRPTQPFTTDANTVALYHLDEGSGDTVNDTSGAVGGPSHGIRKFGGNPAGPEWSNQTPFSSATATPTPTRTPTPAPTASPTSVATFLPSVQISLSAGWNLISLPLSPMDTAPAIVLSDIASYYDMVYAYDAADAADPWKVYAASGTGDLSAMDEMAGYWIYVSTPVTLTIYGTIPMAPAIALRTGWNLVGYPKLTPQPATTALASIAGQYTHVYAYRDGSWQIHQADRPYSDTLTAMGPGIGYWIWATVDTNWMP